MRMRYFTPEEAAQLLPRTEQLLKEIQAFAAEMRSIHQALEQENPPEALPEDARSTAFMRLASLRRQFNAQREQLAQLGIEVKDIHKGLIDFPAMLDGREVCLCWKLGESGIAHWHTIEEGFSGRKPLKEVPPGAFCWFS